MSRTAHAGRRHVVERIAPTAPVIIAFNQPLPDGTSQRVMGRLVAAILQDGQLHHYRISLGQGVMQLTPPGWIDRDSWDAIRAARVTVPYEQERVSWAADVCTRSGPCPCLRPCAWATGAPQAVLA